MTVERVAMWAAVAGGPLLLVMALWSSATWYGVEIRSGGALTGLGFGLFTVAWAQLVRWCWE